MGEKYPHLLQQHKYGWPGLVKEGRTICEKLGIPDVTLVRSDKQEFKNMVTRACRESDERELKEKIERLEKFEFIKMDGCNRKSYIENMNLADARIMFRQRVRLTENAGNY